MILKIDRLTSRDVKTSRGMSKSLSLQAGGVWYGAWAGKWNESWAVNSTIDIPDNRIKKEDKNGKTFWNILAPPNNESQAPSQQHSSEDSDRILKGITACYKSIEALRKEVAELRKEVRSMGAIPL